jgi:hypothetical protein
MKYLETNNQRCSKFSGGNGKIFLKDAWDLEVPHAEGLKD